MLRGLYPFQQIIGTSEPSFNITLSTAVQVFALETSTRFWNAGPTGEGVRFVESSGVDYHVNFGSSTITCVSTGHMMVLGGVAELFRRTPDQAYVAIMTSSTMVSDVNVTLGYGM